MNAMVFAAGLGTRLRPLTNDRPKALVEINGRTLLEHTILKLRDAGFDHIVVNVHHFGEQIIDFLKAHDNYGIDIRVSDERECLLDTGGGIRAALHLFDVQEPILIHNVDIISNIDLRALYQAHIAHSDVAATLAVSKRQTQRYLLFNQQNHLTGWTNIATGEFKPHSFQEAIGLGRLSIDAMDYFAFSGIHVIDPKLFVFLEAYVNKSFPIIDFYLKYCSHLFFNAYDVTNIPWVDCGKPDSLFKAAEVLSSGL